MPTPWAPIGPIRRTDLKSIDTSVVFEKDALWYSGHFPGHPVLPGVAMLTSAVQLAMDGLGLAREDIIGFRKVRFNKLISPGEELTIGLTTSNLPETDELFFNIQSHGKKVGQGFLLLRNDALSKLGA